MATNVGVAYVDILPSADKFGGALKKQLGGATATAGADAGKQAGRSFKTSFAAGAKGLVGVVAPLLAVQQVAGFLKDANDEARESQKVGRLTASIIKSTGSAANITAKQVGDLSAAVSNKTGKDDEAIQSGANLLLTFKNVRNEVGRGNKIFDQATAAAVDLSAAGFGSIESTSKQLGKALNDPIKGISALSRSGVTFTAQQKEQITTLTNSGDVLSAQKIILKEVQSQVGGAAAASASNGEKLRVAFDNFKESVGTALLPMLDSLAKTVTTKVLPVVAGFVEGMSEGTGSGGKFADKVRELASFIRDDLVPAVSSFSGWARRTFGPVLEGHGGTLAKVAGAALALSVSMRAIKAVSAPFGPLVSGGKLAVSGVSSVRTAYANFAKPGGGLDTVRLRAGQVGTAFKNSALAAKNGIVAFAGSTRAMAANALAAARQRVALIAQAAAQRATAVAARVMAVAQRVLNAAMRANPIGIIITVLVALGAAIVLAYRRSATFRTVVQGAFAAIRTAISFAWVNVIRPVFSAFNAYLRNVLFPVIRLLYNGIIKPIFNSMRTHITNVWSKGIKPIFSALGSFIKNDVAPKFRSAVDGIGKIWSGLKKAAGAPVNFVIGTVYNNGIRKVIGAIPGVGTPKALPTLKYAKGGVLPGYTPGRDVHHFQSPTGGRLSLSGGEAIMRPEFTRMVGGPRGVDKLNKLARMGTDMRFAKGGVYWPVPGRQTGTYPGHDGVDINRGSGWDDLGDPIVAAASGRITYAGSGRGYGQAIFQRVAGVGELVYGHTSKKFVKAGQRVTGGQRIGSVGNTGNSSAPHLHFGFPGGTTAQALNFLRGGKTPPGGYGAGVNPAKAKAEAKWTSVITKVPGQIKAVYADIKKMGNSSWTGMMKKAGTQALKSTVNWADNKIPNKFLPDTPIRSALKSLGIFDTGGVLAPGSSAVNLSGKPEAILNNRQWNIMSRAISPARAQGNSGGGMMQLVGQLSIDENGTAWVRGIAEEVADERTLQGI